MNCDICKNKIEEEHVKSLVAFETKRKNGESVRWRKIFNKNCCDRCYEKIVREAGAFGIF